MNILDVLENYIKKNDSSIENIISTYIIQNLEDINEKTLDQISMDTNVSKASLTRFAQKFNLSGFNELKYVLKEHKNTFLKPIKELTINKKILMNDNWYEFYLSIRDEASSELVEYYKHEFIDRVALLNSFKNSKRIFIFAMNIAYNYCKNFAERMRWYNAHVILERDISSINGYKNSLTKDDLVIVITLSGSNFLMLDLLESIHTQCNTFLISTTESTKNKTNFFFPINSIENTLWDIYAIRGTLLTDLLTYLYFDYIKMK